MGARDLVGADLIFTSTKHYNRKCLTIYFKKQINIENSLLNFTHLVHGKAIFYIYSTLV